MVAERVREFVGQALLDNVVPEPEPEVSSSVNAVINHPTRYTSAAKPTRERCVERTKLCRGDGGDEMSMHSCCMT